MNLENKLGQLLMIGIAGPSLSRDEKSLIRKIEPSGIIYFRRNVESPRQLQSLSKSIARLMKEAPPLIGIDQEGGRVARLGPPFTGFPGNDFLGRYYAQTGRTGLVRAQAIAMARELKAIGVNYNFTPIADIDSNPRNPIIGSRSFGNSAREVAKLVMVTIRAYRSEKVVSCAKHFPGHGDTETDSHKVLPVVRTDLKTLERRELVPFRAAIQAGVPTIMTAHVVYPKWDPKNPATLSEKIMVQILRKQLGYRGVLVSDDLEMNAIAGHGLIQDAAVKAIRVGIDLLLVCKSLAHAEASYLKLAQSLKKGLLSKERLGEALGRISRLKKNYLKDGFADRFSPIPADGWAEHRRLADQISSFV